jgi:hypothetical protein
MAAFRAKALLAAMIATSRALCAAGVVSFIWDERWVHKMFDDA